MGPSLRNSGRNSRSRRIPEQINLALEWFNSDVFRRIPWILRKKQILENEALRNWNTKRNAHPSHPSSPPYRSGNAMATTTLSTRMSHLPPLPRIRSWTTLLPPLPHLAPGSIRVSSCAAAGGGGPRGISPDDGRDGRGNGGMIRLPFRRLPEDSVVCARKWI